MINNREIKFLKSLSIKKFRDEHNKFLIEGYRIINELLISNYPLDKIFLSSTFINEHPDINKKILNHEYTIINNNEFNKILNTQNPQGAMALLPIINKSFSADGNTLILDNISNPGNMGTLLRSATWFGIKNILCSSRCVDPYNPKVVRSGMGANFYLSITKSENDEIFFKFIKKLKTLNIPIIGAAVDGISYKDYTNKRSNWALVLGSESKGISHPINELLDSKISIPPKGKIESLNVAIAGSILLDRLVNY